MFQKTQKHTLLTIICASTLITATAPIKAWDLRHTVATGVGATAVGGFVLYKLLRKKIENDFIKLYRIIEKLPSNKNFIPHNEAIIKISHDAPVSNTPEIWNSWAKENGITIRFYFHIKAPNEHNIESDYEIIAVFAGLAQLLIFHNVQKNSFGIPNITPKEFMAHLEKLASERQAKQQPAKQA